MSAPAPSPTAARLTPAGRGAVAVIRVRAARLDQYERGQTVFQAVSGKPFSDLPLRRMVFGRWGWSAEEEVVLCRTTVDSFEIQCHGGEAAVARILADLATLGISTAAPGDQTLFAADLLEVELQSALSRALTWRTADLINEQSRGVLRAAYQRLAACDATPAGLASASRQLADLLEWADFGQHLVEPWSVVLTGRPNVGKSSLINALLGFRRTIVSEQAGTTRDVVTTITAFEGWPVQLADTAGLRDSTDELEATGIARARDRLVSADLRLILLDTSAPPHPDDRQLLRDWPTAIVVAHKSDRPDQWGEALPPQALRVSSVSGAGLDALQTQLAAQLVPHVPPPGTAIPVSARQTQLLREMQVALAAGDMTRFHSSANQLFTG